MKWRKWNNIIHRDLGYLCFGLTIIYVISGIAVNHIATWNPNYTIKRVSSNIGPVQHSGPIDIVLVKKILATLGERGEYKNSYRASPESLQIFVEGNTLSVNLSTGEVFQEIVKPRPILRPLNFLHLNHPKKLWTWFADLYAAALGLLAFTGLFILKGKNGITGRGFWLTGAGILLPILFLWLYL